MIASIATVRRVLQRSLPSVLPPIIVASMGRSGSTLICGALRESVAKSRFPFLIQKHAQRLVTDEAWNLKGRRFIPGVVYKTHGLAHELADNSGARIVFLFGSASDAALSVLACRKRYGATWVDEHFDHLRASGPFSDLGHRDVLRFGEQLDGWVGKAGTPRLILRYDTLWEHSQTLSDFVGVPVNLPERRPRVGARAADEDTRARFAEVYADIDRRVAKMPDCQVLR